MKGKYFFGAIDLHFDFDAAETQDMLHVGLGITDEREQEIDDELQIVCDKIWEKDLSDDGEVFVEFIKVARTKEEAIFIMFLAGIFSHKLQMRAEASEIASVVEEILNTTTAKEQDEELEKIQKQKREN